jgi:chromosome segregation ATPase
VAETLEEKKAKLTQNQNTIDDLGKKNAALKTEIQALEAGEAEIKTIVAAYTASYNGQANDKKKASDTVTAEQAELAPAIKDKKEAIDGKVTKFEKALKDDEDLVTKAEEGANKAATDSAKADEDANKTVIDFNDLKGKKARNDAKIKEVNDLIKQVRDGVEPTDFVSMYVLLNEAQAALNQADILTPPELETKLRAALQEIGTARTDANTKKRAATEARAAADAKKKDHDARVKRRREDLLKAAKA